MAAAFIAGRATLMSGIANKSERQRTAEADVDSFRKERGPFVVAAETTRMAMLFADAEQPNSPIIFANDSLLSLTGYDREEVLGQELGFLLADEADAETLARLATEEDGASEKGVEILCRHKDGTEFWAAVFVSPVRDEGGAAIQYFASFVDLTKHKEDEARSKMLIDELNHRVKNVLATVQSIVWQALRTSSDPKVIQQSIESRLVALSRSHDLLTRENWESAGLFDIVSHALEPYEVSNGRVGRISIEGENIRFPPKSALALGIVFNELATNAVKYGALANQQGALRIIWQTVSAPEGASVILQWQEIGGPPLTPPSRKGFGSRVIERVLAHELEGQVEMDFRAEGLVCSVSIPAPKGS
jgi:PAS domain S-box-containing protein